MGHQRAHVGIGVEAVAQLDFLCAVGDALNHFIENRLFDVEPRSGTTALAVVKEDGIRRAGNAGLQVSIGEENVRRLAAELQRNFLQVAGSGLHDQPANLS